MIDLNCHLLDCGTEAFEASLEMCQLALEDGVRTIVATPRWLAPAPAPPLGIEECRRQLARLHQAMREALSFRLGFLLGYRPDLPELLEAYGSAITLGGGSRVFISLPSLDVPAEAEEVWERVSALGFSILLARAECNPALRRDPARLKRWVESGVMLQLDAASLTGLHGHEIRRFAFQCLKKYEGSLVIASRVGRRSARHSSLALAEAELLKKIDSRRLKRLLSETPAAMIDDHQHAFGERPDPGSLRLPLISRLRALRSNRAVTDET